MLICTLFLCSICSAGESAAKVIEEMMKLNPMFTPPPDFVKSKPHRKLYIPTDEYPGYNFIGEELKGQGTPP